MFVGRSVLGALEEVKGGGCGQKEGGGSRR